MADTFIICEENKWELGNQLSLYHADEHVAGQMNLEIYRKYKEKKMMEPTIDRLYFIPPCENKS